MSQFPGIKPTGRSFKLGTYPTKVYRALSGATFKRSFGNRAFGYELSLEYVNIKDNVTNQLIDHYNVTAGGFTRFTLPNEVFAGMNSDLRGKVQAPTLIRWEYVGPPEVSSVMDGLSSVRIQLAGELTY
jgi:hypothetical protein